MSISTVPNPSSPRGNLRPQVNSSLLTSACTLPAKEPLGFRIPLEDLFSRYFVLGEGDMNRLMGSSETFMLKGLELSGVQDHSARDNSMDRVFVFRVFPESLAEPIKKGARSNCSGKRYIQRDIWRRLSLFEAVMVTWENSSACRRSYYDSVRPGQQTTATIEHKVIDGEDRLIVPGFKPTLSQQQIEERYLRLDDEAMGLLRDGEILHVEELEFADRQSSAGPDGSRELNFIFRVMPDETRRSLTSASRTESIRWGHYHKMPGPLNAVFSAPERQCPDFLLDLQKGEKAQATIELAEINGASRIVVRNVEALQKTRSSDSSSGPTRNEEGEGTFRPPRTGLPDTSIRPDTPSPQFNDEWQVIDREYIHRDQL